jgi:hypothetical protein
MLAHLLVGIWRDLGHFVTWHLACFDPATLTVVVVVGGPMGLEEAE